MAGFKKPVNLEEVIEGKKAQIESLEHQCYTVEQMIAITSDQQYRTHVEKDGLARQAAQKSLEIDEVEQLLNHQVKQMATLAKNSEDHLKGRLATLQKTFDDLEKENTEMKKKLEALVSRRQADLHRWETDVEDKEKQIEEKALSFGLRLRDTLMNIDIR